MQSLQPLRPTVSLPDPGIVQERQTDALTLTVLHGESGRSAPAAAKGHTSLRVLTAGEGKDKQEQDGSDKIGFGAHFGRVVK